MTEFSRLEFIKSQKPVEPLRDWRFWILAIPIIGSVIGIATTSMFSLAFDSVSIIPKIMRDVIAIAGSVITVFAAESNSPGTFFELYRRIFKEEKVTGWDYAALVLSTIGSLATILVVCAIAIMTSVTFSSDAEWVGFVVAWMPLVAALSIVGDNMGALIELASLYASYETRIDAWYERMEQEQASMYSGIQGTLSDRLESLEKQTNLLLAPRANLPWFKSVVSSMNGNLSAYLAMDDKVQSVKALCADNGRLFELSDKTATNWRKEMERVK